MNSQEFFTKASLAALPIAATRVESGDDNPEGWAQGVAVLAGQLAENLSVVWEVQVKMLEEDANN